MNEPSTLPMFTARQVNLIYDVVRATVTGDEIEWSNQERIAALNKLRNWRDAVNYLDMFGDYPDEDALTAGEFGTDYDVCDKCLGKGLQRAAARQQADTGPVCDVCGEHEAMHGAECEVTG